MVIIDLQMQSAKPLLSLSRKTVLKKRAFERKRKLIFFVTVAVKRTVSKWLHHRD